MIGVVAAGCSSDDDGDEGGAATSSTAAGGDSTSSTAAGSGGDEDEPWDGEFSTLIYNVAGLPEILSGSSPEVNTDLIGPKLNDFDLVLMQETWETPDPNPLAPTRVYHEILAGHSTHAHQTEMAPQPLGTNPDRPEALLADAPGLDPNPDAIDPTLVAMNGGEYAWYSENFFPVFAFTSQALGYYTKLDEGRLEGSARRIFDNPANRAKLPALKAAAEAAGRTVSQQALVEIIGTPDAPPAFPTVAIIGCKTLGQLNDSMAAAL